MEEFCEISYSSSGFPNLFDSWPTCLDTEYSATPKHFLFTMIIAIILRFG